MASTTTNTMTKPDIESIKKYLFKITMKSQWKEVVQIYRQNPQVRKARITRTGDTALHIAVSDGQEEHVEKLVQLFTTLKELRIQNDRGNTPLHLAASMGNVRMCECIAKDHPCLVNVLNKDNETPLFLAALHGRKDAFLCLHYICTAALDDPQKRYNNCRRTDGETIYHCIYEDELRVERPDSSNTFTQAATSQLS